MKHDITPETVFVRNENILSTSIDDEIGLMSVEKGKYYAMNTVGSDIWNILGKPTSLNELVSALTSEYNVDTDTCMKQVREYVIKLLDEGIILVR